ncbi:hypothetical protein AB4Z52_29385 [Rhizobium sp. 2YAF20]|uniref:hypothetical protein n=1 Tax=Rhizobium sp. 2YAF20 TaxID=3233027 RepID=UPI003F95FEAA
MTVADEVRAITARHGIEPSTEYPEWVGRQFQRLSGFEGDETLCVIADLKREGIIDGKQATDLTLQHVRETADDAA